MLPLMSTEAGAVAARKGYANVGSHRRTSIGDASCFLDTLERLTRHSDGPNARGDLHGTVDVFQTFIDNRLFVEVRDLRCGKILAGIPEQS
jgi:hypothetical protein